MNAQTKFGSIENFEKGGVEITGKDEAKRYLFSNMFEVAGNSAAWERVVVAKNLEFTIEVSRADGTSPWYLCAHDETVLLVQGEADIHFIKPSDSSVIPAEDSEGAIRLATEPQGTAMGFIRAARGHLCLLPAGTAYQLKSPSISVLLYQSALGEESLEKWAEICQQ